MKNKDKPRLKQQGHSLSFSSFSCTDPLSWRANRSDFSHWWALLSLLYGSTGANSVGNTAETAVMSKCTSGHVSTLWHHFWVWSHIYLISSCWCRSRSIIDTDLKATVSTGWASCCGWMGLLRDCHPGERDLCPVSNILYFSFIIFPFPGFCCSLFRFRQQHTLLGSGKDGLGDKQTESQS